MKLYVSGSISENPNYIRDFSSAAEALEKAGYEVVNPCKLHGDEEKSWEAYMKRDIQALMECDGVALLDGWQRSRGARIEYNLASDLSMPSERIADWVAKGKGGRENGA